jgi:predicted acetyltransferase
MTVTVRSLAELADPEAGLAEAHRVDAVAFGAPPDPDSVRAKRPSTNPSRWYLADWGGEPCGAAGSFPFELTVPGGGTVAVAGVSDVGVMPTHRRRGVLRSLMQRLFDEAGERGEVAAVLHASEASIYRRFGFGPATRWRQVRIDTHRAAYRPEWPDPGGRYREVPRSAAAGACAAVHDATRRVTVGGLSRTPDWWSMVLGDTEMYLGGGTKRMVILHEDDAGRADGYVIYEVDQDWSTGQSSHTLRIWELVGVDHRVELGLWRTVLDHDLLASVTGPLPVDHVLGEVMEDPRQLRTLWEQDLLWARLLDVARALGARRYAADGTLVLEVLDSSGFTGGTFRLESHAAGATCALVETAADLRIHPADLGACWLGGTSFRQLVRAGRVAEARPGVAEWADAMFAVDPAPWCWVRF